MKRLCMKAKYNIHIIIIVIVIVIVIIIIKTVTIETKTLLTDSYKCTAARELASRQPSVMWHIDHPNTMV